MKKREVKPAPWRLEYLQNGPGTNDGCFICAAVKQTPSPENLVLVKNCHCAVMLNRYPYNNGHVMVVPILHVSRLTLLPDDVLSECAKWLRKTEEILQTVYNPDGFNIGINLGSAAGAGLQEHVHIHVLPRWSGDTNFMTTVGDVRVIPEMLASTWKRLSAELETEKEKPLQ